MQVKRTFFVAVVNLLLCLSLASMGQAPDPGVMGPHAVTKAEYNLGDAAYTPPPAAMFPFAMEVRGSVHYPSDIATMTACPVLIWLHGRHETCYDPSSLSTYSSWPCTAGDSPIVSYEGYDYAARTMASWGYIVISISANSINANDAGLSDAGMNARGVLTQHHMDLWNGWNTTVTTGPFGSTFVGKLNMQNIGTMGHSRGGEGVIFNAEYNRSLGSPYGIKAILTLAPVDFFRHVVNGIPLLDIAPYCDGDVSDLEGVHFYDDARYKVTTDETPKHTLLVMGANHNYFNTVWTPVSYPAGGIDDWTYSGEDTSQFCGVLGTPTGRLDTTKQKAVYNTYAAAFYRLYLGHETKFAPLLQVNYIAPPASALVDSTYLFVSYHAGKSDRLDINRVDTAMNLTLNNLTDTVRSSGLTSPAICGGGLTLSSCDPGLGSDQKPHRGTSAIKGLDQMRIEWSDTTQYYENDIPAANQDFTGYQSITFRACVNFVESSTSADFTVQLIDSAGATASQDVSNFSKALFHQPGRETSLIPKEVFNTIRIPLSGFSGVNLAKIRHIKFKFNRAATGAVLVSDLALTNPICGNINAVYTDSIPTNSYKVYYKNKSTATTGDTISYLWNFGDATSGVNDTSTLANPTHIYPRPGFYTVCLYETVKRANGLGMVCYDTTCTTVTVRSRTAVNTIAEPEITIIPNPAKDYLQINGADKNDVLKLVNVYGQEVLSTNITQPIIDLPQTLTNGLYYAVILSPRGNVYQKIIIAR